MYFRIGTLAGVCRFIVKWEWFLYLDGYTICFVIGKYLARAWHVVRVVVRLHNLQCYTIVIANYVWLWRSQGCMTWHKNTVMASARQRVEAVMHRGAYKQQPVSRGPKASRAQPRTDPSRYRSCRIAHAGQAVPYAFPLRSIAPSHAPVSMRRLAGQIQEGSSARLRQSSLSIPNARTVHHLPPSLGGACVCV